MFGWRMNPANVRRRVSMFSPEVAVPQPPEWVKATMSSTFGKSFSACWRSRSTIARATVAEQFTVVTMPTMLRVATRPSSRTKPWKVARSASGTKSVGL